MDNKNVDWVNCSDEELLAEAKRRYPKGTVVKRIDCKIGVITSSGEFDSCGGIVHAQCISEDEWSVFGNYVSSNPPVYKYNVWAEIARQPEAEQVHFNYDDILAEPKAGDVVEVDGLNGLLKLIQTHNDEAWVSNENCSFIVRLSQLRLPQKSEGDNEANRLAKCWYLSDGDGKENMIKLFHEAIKWGQKNPNAK